jgi:hypothetical protein
MAGIDVLNAFPNSKMAKAVKLGQSRFMTGEEFVETGVFSEQSPTFGGIFTPDGGEPTVAAKASVLTIDTAGAYTTAELLAALGFATNFDVLNVAISSSSAGVSVAQGTGSIVLKSGAVVAFPGPITATQNPVTITLAAGDVVVLNAQGE